MASKPENNSHAAHRPFEEFMHLLSPGPRVDVTQREDELMIEADVPGMSADEIAIELHDDVLVLSGERGDKRRHRDVKLWRSERMFGSFSRIIHLPRSVDTETATIRFERGVLQINVQLKR